MTKFIVTTVGGQPLVVRGVNISDQKFERREDATAEIGRLMEQPHLLPARAQSVLIAEVDE